jgi:hypothetical protein
VRKEISQLGDISPESTTSFSSAKKGGSNFLLISANPHRPRRPRPRGSANLVDQNIRRN